MTCILDAKLKGSVETYFILSLSSQKDQFSFLSLSLFFIAIRGKKNKNRTQRTHLTQTLLIFIFMQLITSFRKNYFYLLKKHFCNFGNFNNIKYMSVNLAVLFSFRKGCAMQRKPVCVRQQERVTQFHTINFDKYSRNLNSLKVQERHSTHLSESILSTTLQSLLSA